MDQPAETPASFRVNDGGLLRSGIAAAAAGGAFLLAVLAAVLVVSEASAGDLLLPAFALASFWIAWLLVAVIRSGIARRLDRRGIVTLFGGELWGVMRFENEEWSAVVRERHSRSDDEVGMGIRLAGAFGLLIAVFMTLVGWLATDDRSISIALTGAAIAVVVLFVSVAAVQPRWQRHVSSRETATSLQVSAPRIWFGPTGVYHEADGLTSCRDLVEVADRTKSKGSIVFTVLVKYALNGPDSADVSATAIPVEVEIPKAHRSETAGLARRYREQLRP